MLKMSPVTILTALAALLSLSAGVSGRAVQASSTFGQQEVNQDDFVLMATPYQGGSKHQLSIIGQASRERGCWSEQGNQPAIVTPLLLNFDFSGICTRSVDGNGYSIRIDGQDQYLTYTPKIINAGGELQLIARPTRSGLQELVIARSYGTPLSFSKLMLQPGWRLTKRSYQGQALGHLYLTYDSSVQSSLQATERMNNSGSNISAPRPVVVESRSPFSPGQADEIAPVYLRQVSALYREMVGEEIENDRARLYARLLSSGTSIEVLRTEIANSEPASIAVSIAYEQLVGVEISTTELRHYRDRLKQGWSLAEVEWDMMQADVSSSASRPSSRL